MQDTIFTKIAKRKIPSYILAENDEFMAILDIYPQIYGQFLVIPKEWHDSYIFNNDSEFIKRMFEFASKIAKKVDSKLGTERCRVLFEGLEVAHLHMKVYPLKSSEDINLINSTPSYKLTEKDAEEIMSLIN